MTDLNQFGKQLQTLRKGAGLSQEQLVEALDRLARSGPATEHRVVDGTLISRWERAHVQSGRQWKPTRPYVLHLINLFANQLNREAAQTWAAQAGYQVSATELEQWFSSPAPAPTPGTKGANSAHHKNDTPSPRHNLPTALTSFVGRTDEIATVVEALTASPTRLLTIVGEGGVGKTRLALAAAEAIAEYGMQNAGHGVGATPHSASRIPSFPDGVWFVPLAGLDAGNAPGIANQLASAVAKALAFSFHRVTLEPAAQLIDFLRPKRLLLILDNFEHLTAATPFVLELLHEAPQVRVLVTSRAPLNCQAERLLVLQGLPVPAEGTQQAFDLPSVQLFTERARQQVSTFSLDAQTVQDVARLCRLVNGNPLGMELAAHWVQHFTVTEMVAALQQQDRSLLATDQHDVPIRHRSMEAVFETSWQLLSPSTQRTLAQLTVFRGAFAREAALAVTNATLNQLVELVNRSLLHTAQESSGRRHYLMHELLRQLAMSRLVALAETEPGLALSVHERHSNYYLTFLAERTNTLYGSKMNLVVGEVQGSLDNIRTAWQWAVTHANVDAVTRAWPGLRTFYHVRSLYQEGEEVFRLAAARLPRAQAGALTAELQVAQAFFLNLLHRYDEAIAVARTVLARQQGNDVAPVVARAQVEWGIALSFQNKHDEALPLLSQAVQRARDLDLPLVEARAHHAMFRVLLPKGDLAAAKAALEQSLRLYQQLGYRLGEGFILRSLGYIAQHQNQYTQALIYWEEALAIYQQVEDQPRAISLWKHLGDAYEGLGDLGRAYSYYQAAYTGRDETQDPRAAAHTITGFARLLARLGEYAQAHQYAQQALAEQRRLGDYVGVIETLCTLGWVHQQLGEVTIALTLQREALQLSQASSVSMYEGLALLGIGQAHAALGANDEAVAAYQQALAIQRELGQQHWVLETLSELARIALAQGRPAAALALVEEILAGRAASAPPRAREPLEVALVCYRVLQAAGDPRGGPVLTDAYQRLQNQAATLEDDALRQSFLGDVAVNRELRAAHEAASDSMC
jgi:predicted ATPase/transcriptional regulator with XRE-family HTH domain